MTDTRPGEAIWTWASLDHVDPSASYANPGETGGSQDNPWDYFASIITYLTLHPYKHSL